MAGTSTVGVGTSAVPSGVFTVVVGAGAETSGTRTGGTVTVGVLGMEGSAESVGTSAAAGW